MYKALILQNGNCILFGMCTPKEAIQIQRELALKVRLQDEIHLPVVKVAGMDVSFNRFDPSQKIFGSCVLLNSSTMEIVEVGRAEKKETFPYISGLLGFREAPVLIEAFKQLKEQPDVILVDGHGFSHPRGLGIASHIGVLLDIPTIGVAKSILVGQPKGDLDLEAGSETSLVWKEREIARVVRSKKNCLPLIISAGHKISLDRAVEIVEKCHRGYRLPEPTRQAHLEANVFRKELI